MKGVVKGGLCVWEGGERMRNNRKSVKEGIVKAVDGIRLGNGRDWERGRKRTG